MPVYFDTYGDVKKAFAQWATPAYYIVDGTGRLIFERTTLAEVPRQIEALAGI